MIAIRFNPWVIFCKAGLHFETDGISLSRLAAAEVSIKGLAPLRNLLCPTAPTTYASAGSVWFLLRLGLVQYPPDNPLAKSRPLSIITAPIPACFSPMARRAGRKY